MTTVGAYADLRRMSKPILTTRDAAERLRISTSAATRLLTRLEGADLARRIFRGLWTLDLAIDPLAIPEHLTVPFPAYISFQSALYLHGMIGQIPQITYVASLAPTRRVKTAMGTYSIHRLAPGFFGGYTTSEDSGVRVATPVKALLDVLYLASARSRLFARLPELELPPGFRAERADPWIERIRDPVRRSMVRTRLDALLGGRAANRSLAKKVRPKPRGKREA